MAWGITGEIRFSAVGFTKYSLTAGTGSGWLWLDGMTRRPHEGFLHITGHVLLTHWGRVTHICVIKLTIIVSDNGLSPCRRQAIIWTNAGILLIGTNFGEISIKILTFSYTKMRLKVSSAKWRPFCLGLNVLTYKLVIQFGTGYFCHHCFR